MNEWHKDQLRNGKLIVRGELDPNDPFTFKFELFMLMREPTHESLLCCTYWRNEGYNNRFPVMQCSDWRAEASRWPASWSSNQLLVITDKNEQAIAPVHYLPQLYGLTEAIDLAPPGVGGWSEDRSTLLKRLRAAYNEQLTQVQQAVGRP